MSTPELATGARDQRMTEKFYLGRVRPKTFSLTPLRGFTPTFATFGLRNIGQLLNRAKVTNVTAETVMAALHPRPKKGLNPVEFRSDGCRVTVSFFVPKKEGIDKMSKAKGAWRKVSVPDGT